MSKNLIAYYTYSPDSITKQLADAIKEVADGDVFEILPVNPYSPDRDALIEQAKKDSDAGILPEIQSVPESLAEYDTIFVGAPNWFSTIAPPLITFLSKLDFTGKKVVLFFTYAGSGLGKAQEDVIKLAAGATVLDPIVVKASDIGTAKEVVTEAIGKLDL
jgi:flavodoxin